MEDADVFVTKLDATGSGLLYSTYLGGGGGEDASGIAVDATGSAYVSGSTHSNDFPTTAGAFDTTWNGGSDAFVAKLGPTGAALLYSTYLGGGSSDFGLTIAVDAAGSAYVTGSTHSRNFPTTAGAFDSTFNGGGDAFVTKLNGMGSGLPYSTYLGGGRSEVGWSIAVHATGSAYVTGRTDSRNFPTTAGAFDSTFNGGEYDVFVTKIEGTGSHLLYSTYLGGRGRDDGDAIAVDAAGRAHVTGDTESKTFPTTGGALDGTFNGRGDVFALALAECGRVTVARRTRRAGVRMVVRVRVLEREGLPLMGVRVTARGAGVRTAARAGSGGYARIALRPRRAGVVTIRAGSRAACVRRIRIAGTGNPPLTG